MTESALAIREQTAIERVQGALESRIDRITELLPPSMDPRRFVSVSLMALSKNPGLIECDRSSIVLAILEAAEVGLEPTGGIGGAHLVPFRGKDGQKHAQLIYDYRGIQYLIREGGGGEVKTVLVYEGDYFKVYEGTENARIRHTKRFMTQDPAKIQFVYAVPLDHPTKFEVMTKAEIDGIRARSKAANSGPWVSDYGAMSRKSVLKRLSAWLPLKPSARAAIERDTEREIGLDEDSGEPIKSRTAEVRDRIRANSGPKRRQPATDQRSAPEGAQGTDVSSSDVSASQQPELVATEVVEGQVSELCGAEGTDIAEGEVCGLSAHHAEKVHKSADGKASWPVEPAS